MRTVTWIAIAAALAGACGDRSSEPPPAAPPSHGIEVVRAGAAPAQPLRYQLTRGQRTAVQLEVEMDMAMGGVERAMPTRVIVMEVGADEVRPDGNAVVRTTIVRGAVRDRPGANVPIEGLSAQAAMVAGLETTGTLTPRGRILDAKLASGGKQLPAQAQQELAESLKQIEELAMPLPEPAVGVGAVWRFRRPLRVFDVAIDMITEIEVTAIEDRRVSFRSRTEVKGADQTGAMEGVKLEVKNIRGSGGGAGVLDLGRMVLTADQRVELSFDVAAGGSATSARMKVVTRMKPPTDPDAAAPAPAGGSASPPAPPATGAPAGHDTATRDDHAPPAPAR